MHSHSHGKFLHLLVPHHVVTARQAFHTRLLILLFALSMTGCFTTQKNMKSGIDSSEVRVRNEGYSLLYRLLSDEGNVDKILYVKSADKPIADFIKEIAATYRDSAEQLKRFQESDPALDVKMKLVLPEIDEKARGAIAFATAKELLTSSGEEFERRLLLTQVSATNYGTHLSRVLLDRETDPQRKAYLENLAERCGDFHERVIALLRVTK